MSETRSSSVSRSARSSFFARIRNSFVRSNGDRGADVRTLRGTKGADFENIGHISRGVGSFGCLFCLRGNDDSRKENLILIKGTSLFVFSSQDAPSPKYAVPLGGIVARLASNSPTVLLEDCLGDLQYEVVFDSEQIASEFCRVVKAKAESARSEETRKKLGHEKMINKRSSHIHADEVARQKEKDQPEKPISSEDIMKNMDVPVGAM